MPEGKENSEAAADSGESRAIRSSSDQGRDALASTCLCTALSLWSTMPSLTSQTGAALTPPRHTALFYSPLPIALRLLELEETWTLAPGIPSVFRGGG